MSDYFTSAPPPAAPSNPQPAALGAGQVKVGLILPLSAAGNAGLVAQSMKNAAELAIAEFNNPNIQLLVKDDAGTAQGAQQAAQQALSEGAEIILGPLFAHAVGPAAEVARAKNIPVIAFSTDTNVARTGVYLLSFLPENDVERVVSYAASQGKRSYAALLPDNAYGTVVEAELKQAVAKKNGRVVVVERYAADRAGLPDAAKRLGQAAGQIDTVMLADNAESVPEIAQALNAGLNGRRVQIIGTGLWDDPRIFSEGALQGGWYAAPDMKGYQGFSARYRAKFGQDPVRTATLAYDSVSLIAALVKTQGDQRFSEAIFTNASGFAGIDGIFRFKSDGTNQRGLAVLRVGPSAGEVVSAPPKAFSGSGT